MKQGFYFTLVGRVGKTPELRTSKSGKEYASLSVAFGGKDNTTWVQVMLWEEAAKYAAGNAKPGMVAIVEGAVRPSKAEGSFDYVIYPNSITLAASSWRPEWRGSGNESRPSHVGGTPYPAAGNPASDVPF